MPRLADAIQDLELQAAEGGHYCDPLDRDDMQGEWLDQCQQEDDASAVGRGCDE